jgi:ADP-ribosylglycohydrolase
MARPTTTLADRARGALLGLAAGWHRGRTEPVTGEIALAWLLAEELLETPVDLHRLAARWTAWWRRDGRGLSSGTVEALEHLARQDMPPPPERIPAEAGPLVRCLPVALATATTPRNLVSGTYHTVILTHPEARTAWSAVAVNVAVAQFLLGRRDFIADVIEVLAVNDAPTDLLAVARRIPLVTRDELFPARATHGPAVAAAELALWAAYHEPLLPRGLAWAASVGRESNGDGDEREGVVAALVGAVLGARDGERAVPADWLRPVADQERIRTLAKRLVAERRGLE